MDLYFPNKIDKTASFLLAVSGGVDSMVLLELFYRGNLNFSVAHMNFNLRGEEADKDENLVRNTCLRLGVKFYSKKVNTKDYKKQQKISTQMAARELRYNWFSELCENHRFSYIVTAHHADDQVETFFINLLRKSGTKGLSAMQVLNGNIFRPLISFSKKEILSYAIDADLVWREDASNQSNDYIRNSIRNKLIPVLKEIDVRAFQSILDSTTILKEENDWMKNRIFELKKRLFNVLDDYTFSIKITELKEIKPLNTTLYYLFSPYGFKIPQEIKKIIKARNSAELESDTHRLIKNRDEILLSEKKNNDFLKINMEIGKKYNYPINLLLTKSLNDSDLKVSFDYKNIKFPLYLRRPKKGDYFFPAGMRGKTKKLAKYFKDEKFSKLEKEQVFLLVDAEDNVLWVIGHRQDERFKANNKTTIWLHAEF